MNNSAWQKFRKDKWGIAALIVVILYFCCAVCVEIYDANCRKNHRIQAYNLSSEACYAPPSSEHWCGTDYQGRDVFLRTVAGSASALKTGMFSGIIAVFIGVTLGMFSGYFGGKCDEFTVWLFSTFSALPTLLFIRAFALITGGDFLSAESSAALETFAGWINAEPGMLGVYLAIGLTGWVALCRIARAETMKLKNQTFVQAAKVSGVSNRVIIFRHILPNIMHLVIIYFTLRFAYAVMTEVLVSYLGLGVQNAPSWGIMISDGQERLWRGVWWEAAAASGFMFILVLSLNLLGDGLRDIFDPKNESR